jgi:hypothetical protein
MWKDWISFKLFETQGDCENGGWGVCVLCPFVERMDSVKCGLTFFVTKKSNKIRSSENQILFLHVSSQGLDKLIKNMCICKYSLLQK